MKTTLVFIDISITQYWFSGACKFNNNNLLLIIPLFMHCYFIDNVLFFTSTEIREYMRDTNVQRVTKFEVNNKPWD